MPEVLTSAERTFLAEARTATLATIGPRGRPRLVPLCFVVIGDTVWSPLDAKPKAVADPRALARVRDIVARPEVALLVDRWSEEWSELAWLRARGRAELVEPDAQDRGRGAVVSALCTKYRQYVDHDLAARPMIRIEIEGATSWGAISPSP